MTKKILIKYHLREVLNDIEKQIDPKEMVNEMVDESRKDMADKRHELAVENYKKLVAKKSQIDSIPKTKNNEMIVAMNKQSMDNQLKSAELKKSQTFNQKNTVSDQIKKQKEFEEKTKSVNEEKTENNTSIAASNKLSQINSKLKEVEIRISRAKHGSAIDNRLQNIKIKLLAIKVKMQKRLDKHEKLNEDSPILPIKTKTINQDSLIKDYLYSGHIGSVIKYLIDNEINNENKEDVTKMRKASNDSIISDSIRKIKFELYKKEPNKDLIKELKNKIRTIYTNI